MIGGCFAASFPIALLHIKVGFEASEENPQSSCLSSPHYINNLRFRRGKQSSDMLFERSQSWWKDLLDLSVLEGTMFAKVLTSDSCSTAEHIPYGHLVSPLIVLAKYFSPGL
jgi:hypothetical protein